MSPASQEATSQKEATPRKAQARRRRLGANFFNIYRLVIKELRSIRSDPVMLILVVYAFSIAVYTVGIGVSTEATNLSVGVVDEDRSDLSRRIADGLTPPSSNPP
jgi:ABC-2 type transport system permease protein